MKKVMLLGLGSTGLRSREWTAVAPPSCIRSRSRVAGFVAVALLFAVPHGAKGQDAATSLDAPHPQGISPQQSFHNLAQNAAPRVGPQNGLSPGSVPSTADAASPQTEPNDPGPMISLVEAIRRAQASEAGYVAKLAESRATGLDRSIARAALLPNAVYHNQYLYTQPNGQILTSLQTAGTQPAPRFIANNTVHEYMSQGVVTETLGFAQIAELRRADAAAALARAEAEIARRGLANTVAGLYYTALASTQKVQVADRALREAEDFSSLTGKRENAREVAHADVIKAQLQQQQRQRDAADARLAADKARLELGVLLFPDPRTPYQLEPARGSVPLPDRAALQATASSNNPELASALAALRQSEVGVLTSRSVYLPALELNYTYGIDAPQFATRGPGGIHNLGYSASATLDIPIWDWLSTEHKVKQSEIRRDAVRVALTAAQRRAVADFDEFYAEAVVANEQSASLEVSVRTAADSLRLTKLRYTEGEATVLEVVDAETALTAAENAREDGIVRYQQAIANLQTLTGSL
jgi:outer membrane protein TolC